jgi:hypothetical protein
MFATILKCSNNNLGTYIVSYTLIGIIDVYKKKKSTFVKMRG